MSCEVLVLYFAKSSELAGVRSENICVPQQVTSKQLWEKISALHPRLSVLEGHIVFAVCQEYVSIGDEIITLHPGDEIAVIPPISGGAMDEPRDIIRISSEILSTNEVSQLVVSPDCGAVSIFIGTTRNNFEGKKVVCLEYEAYVPMAELEMKKIFSDIRQKWPSVKHMAVHHRLGLVPITEASVIIAISSPHRNDSLDAVKYCIDTLKATVPIWKKELYEEGYTWKENKECFWGK